MKFNNATEKFITDALLLSSLTAFMYFLIYQFRLGYYTYFKVPELFINIDVVDLVRISFVILTSYVIIYVMIKGSDDKKVAFIIFMVVGGIVSYILKNTLYYTVLFWGGALVAIIYYGVKFVINDKVIISEKILRMIFPFLIVGVLAFGFLFNFIGHYAAKTQEMFNVAISESQEYIILGEYNGKFIAKPYHTVNTENSENNITSNFFTFIECNNSIKIYPKVIKNLKVIT